MTSTSRHFGRRIEMAMAKDRIGVEAYYSDSGLRSVGSSAGRKPQTRDSTRDGAEESGKTEEGNAKCDFLVRTIGLLSTGIGNTRQNYWLGRVGLVFWILTNVIHFSLDFYEARFVFHISWASTVALFLIALLLCTVSSVRYSIPWFIKGVRKLSRNGEYPKTMKKVCLYFKVIRILIIPLSVVGAMGQFCCYAHDDALDLNFNDRLSTNHSASDVHVPNQVIVIVNTLRATSLVHVYYGFWFFLLAHLGMIYLIKCSMEEYIEFMAKALRQNPVCISFSEAVNSFAARSRFVHRGSSNTMGVFTVLLVVCSTSFVLNAYNYLFLKKYAIYIWFALTPVIWAVTPLIGAAWVTRHYQRYKLIVVNAWVDIPDDEGVDDDDNVIQESFRRIRVSPRPNSNTALANNVDENHLKVNGIAKGRSFQVSPSPVNESLDRKGNDCSIGIKKSHSLTDLSPRGIPVSPHDPASQTRLNGVRSFADVTKLAANAGYAVENKTSHEENREESIGKNSKTFKQLRIEVTDVDKESENGRSPSESLKPCRVKSRRSQTSQVFSGIAKTYSRWRARVKAKRKFNFEKYITYLDNTLPTIGFCIGGVVITWDAVSGFCFLLFTLVGIFAQEAFFGG